MTGELLLYLLFFLVVAGGMLTVLWWIRRSEARRQQQVAAGLREVAARCGLKVIEPPQKRFSFFSAPFPHAEAEEAGMRLVLQPKVEVGVSSRNRATTLTVRIPGAEARRFLICPALGGLASTMHRDLLAFAKLNPETEDVRTGDAEFDETFYLKTNDARFLQSLLDEPLRESLLGGPGRYRGQWSITLKKGVLTYSEPSLWTEPAKADLHAGIVNALRRLARAVKNSLPGPGPIR